MAGTKALPTRLELKGNPEKPEEMYYALVAPLEKISHQNDEYSEETILHEIQEMETRKDELLLHLLDLRTKIEESLKQ